MIRSEGAHGIGHGWVAAAVLAAAACTGGDRQAAGAGELSGAIEVDGSSTVYPITEAVAEEFMIETDRSVRITVGVSGTGGGFKRFCLGQTAISNASRPIKPIEAEQCAQAGVEFIELPVAYDGIAIVTNPASSFVECLTVDELRRIWEPGSSIRRWSDVRPAWPADPMPLYGAGTDSGTFDYFTDAIVGQEDASRADYTASEDDNVLIQGVIGNRSALGYVPFAYHEENAYRLKLIAVDGGGGCVRPTRETIQAGEYAPLSRPVFIYVNTAALARPEVRAFVDYYMTVAGELVPQVGYVALSPAEYRENLDNIGRTAGATRG